MVAKLTRRREGEIGEGGIGEGGIRRREGKIGKGGFERIIL
jgi:hypothetical protein